MLDSHPIVGLSNSGRALQVSLRKIVDAYWMFRICLVDFWWNWMVGTITANSTVVIFLTKLDGVCILKLAVEVWMPM